MYKLLGTVSKTFLRNPYPRINVTSVIINHPKESYFTEQNKPCSIEKRGERFLWIENKFPIVKEFERIIIRSHLPNQIAHSQC